MGLPVNNRLPEPMTLTEEQVARYEARPFVDLEEGFLFLEELLPKHSQVKSKVPFMTLVTCLCELLWSGGDRTLVRRLWGHFCSLLGEQQPDCSLN